MENSGTISFTIGEEFGIRIMQIAQEILIYKNDPIKAIKFITDSLHGCTTEMAIKIIKGDIVLIVDEEDQSVIPMNRIPEFHDHIFPKIDPLYFMETKERQISKHCDELIDEWSKLKYTISRDGYMFHPSIEYNSIFKFIAGEDKYLLEELKLNSEIDHITSLINTSKAFIKFSSGIKDTIIWMCDNWSEFDHGFDNFHSYLSIKGNISDNIITLMQLMQETLNLNFKVETEDKGLQMYIDAARAIDAAMSKGIDRVNILDNWSAGWLSPSGDYYALNGEIANMLHIQLADALQKKGLIPSVPDEAGLIPTPDSWLDQNGWVKVHGDMIDYGGTLNYKIGSTAVYMNALQVDIIYKYIQTCHNGEMLLGWKKEPISAARFQMRAKSDIIALSKEYFNF